MADLSGKVAIVTGASRGIGVAAAQELARCGAAVLLTARSRGAIEEQAAEIGKAGGRAEALGCDVARWEDVRAAAERCESAFGRIDILVNNAGVIEPIAHLGDSDPAAWGEVVDINLKGVYHGLRAVLPAMERQGSGTVINISSGAATSALEGWSHYCSTKAAVLMLTKMVHQEYGDRGITCIGLSPGTVATGMQRSIKASGMNPVSALEWEDHIDPSWPARAIAYLCTDDAKDLAGTDFTLKTEEERRRAGLV